MWFSGAGGAVWCRAIWACPGWWGNDGGGDFWGITPSCVFLGEGNVGRRRSPGPPGPFAAKSGLSSVLDVRLWSLPLRLTVDARGWRWLADSSASAAAADSDGTTAEPVGTGGGDTG